MSGLTDPVEVLANWQAAPFREGTVTVGELEVVIDVQGLGRGRRIGLAVRNPGRQAVSVDHVALRLDAWPDQVVEHGHQSWSVVRRCRLDDTRPERAEQPDWVRGAYLSDPGSAGVSVAGDQFLVTTDGVVGFLDARHHLGTVTASPRGVTATALLDQVELAPGQERVLDSLWLASGDPGPLYSELAAHWGDEAGARVTAPAPLGWCSWYQFWGQVTPGDVRANLAIAAGRGFDLVQIDDGWQAAIGDWLATAEAWQEGTAAVAKEITGAGLLAGIWTAPFLAGEGSRLARDHPDWLAVHASGRPMRAMWNPGGWGGWAWALDTTRPEVLDHLREVYAALRGQGFDYHKIDFCFAAALPARRADPSLTRAQALRAGLLAVRDGLGGDAYLLGCGCPFGPAVGVVDAMRVSADVGPQWAPAASWPGFAEAAPAAVNAIQATVLRAPLHRRLFVSDPDCLLLRPTDTSLSAGQRAFLAAVITGCGGFTMVSDDLSRYTEAEWGLLEAVRAVRLDVDTPLDLVDPFADPVVVRSRAGTELRVDWRPGADGGPRAELGVW